ncbi:MAG TPA: hypothetical protein VIC04_09220, partial [Terriglobia bacterium]
MIAGLRYRLLINSLRTVQGQLELISKILLLLTGAMMALGGGMGFFAAGLALSAPGRERLLQLPLWGVFAAWFFLPMLIGAFRAEFEFRNLLRYPMRYSAFYTLSLAYGLFDFCAVLALIWLGGFGAGLIVARPALAWWTIPVLAAYAATMLTLNCVVYSWLERLLATRKARERFFVLVLLAMLSIQFIGPLGERYAGFLKPLLRALLPALDLLPPGLAGSALASSLSSFSPATLGALAGLVACAGCFAWLLHRRLRAQFLGEHLSETQAPSARPAEKFSAAS